MRLRPYLVATLFGNFRNQKLYKITHGLQGAVIRYREGASIRYGALRICRKWGGYKVQLNFFWGFGIFDPRDFFGMRIFFREMAISDGISHKKPPLLKIKGVSIRYRVLRIFREVRVYKVRR